MSIEHVVTVGTTSGDHGYINVVPPVPIGLIPEIRETRITQGAEILYAVQDEKAQPPCTEVAVFTSSKSIDAGEVAVMGARLIAEMLRERKGAVVEVDETINDLSGENDADHDGTQV